MCLIIAHLIIYEKYLGGFCNRHSPPIDLRFYKDDVDIGDDRCMLSDYEAHNYV